jgi:hypothetical protein
MSSPTESVRETVIALLSDPVNGLNPAFVALCQSRSIPVPIAGDAAHPDAPFDFGPNSNNVFRMREDIDWLGRNSNQQYPCLVIYGKSAKQERGPARIKGIVFQGVVVVEIVAYLAWYTTEAPSDNDFERPLDALEEAIISVLNARTANWIPVLYENLVDTEERFPLTDTSVEEVVRRGIRMSVTANVVYGL